MRMKLSYHRYGKARVRVLKVLRQGSRHTLKELEISVMLQGDFEASFIGADNRLIVPTDTMKNTVYVLARQQLGTDTEAFGLALGRHFLDTYPQVSHAEIGLSERSWDRMIVEDHPHDHSFVQHS